LKVADSKQLTKLSNFRAARKLPGADRSCGGVAANARNVAIRNWPVLCFVRVTADLNSGVLRLERQWLVASGEWLENRRYCRQSFHFGKEASELRA